MKALMKGYVYWFGMDKEIENLVKTYKNYALAAKTPPVKFNPWPISHGQGYKLNIRAQ